MRKTNGEDALHRACADYLGLMCRRQATSIARDLVWFHVPNGGWRTKGQAGRFRAMGVLAGVADFIIVLPPHGRVLGIELKTATGRSSPAQAEFSCKLARAGGLYYVCRSLTEFIKTVDAVINPAQ